MREFKAAAPDDVEVVECPPGGVVGGLDRYVVGNCLSYPKDTAFHGPFIRYHHDITESPMDALLAKHEHCSHIFCSPLQRKRMKGEGECIPPALDLKRFQVAPSNGREGAVWLGMHPRHPGKGLDLAMDSIWVTNGVGGLDVYGNDAAKGLVPYEDVPRILSQYQTFVHLPRALEPFGRSVVEAWAAGCDLVVNKNVGALYWIQQAQEKLKSAAEDFWGLVLR